MRLPKITASILVATTLLAGCGASTDGSLSSSATLMALNAVGLKVSNPLPEVGCSVSAIPPEKVMELLMAVPDQQRLLLAQVLDASAVAWSVQLYSGAGGIGFCFPAENTLIMLPAKSTITQTPTDPVLTTDPVTTAAPGATTSY